MNTSLDPILKIVSLAHGENISSIASSMADRALALFLMGAVKKGLDCFALHDIETIKKALKAKGMELPDIPLDAPITLRISGFEPIVTPLIPAAWSVAGLLCHMGKNVCLQHLMMGKLHEAGHRFQGFRQPESLPIVEPFLLRRGLTEPLGQWLPAYKDSEGRLHDLIDLSIECKNASCFSLSVNAVQARVEASLEAKAGYLGRQAGHGYDTFLQDHVRLIQRATNKNAPHGQVTPIEKNQQNELKSGVGVMISKALLSGAVIPQAAWAGSSGYSRTFSHNDLIFRELVHSLAIYASSESHMDEVRSKTIQRMHAEGHDVVILHADNDERNQHERHVLLPLHFWAEMGQPLTVAALLQAGADTKALVYGCGDNPNVGKNIHDVIETMGVGDAEIKAEIGAMIHSFEARQLAISTILEMSLQDAPFNPSFLSKKP